MKSLSLLTCSIVLLICGGCTTAQLYTATQSWQRNECAKIFDTQERNRCMADTSTTYEEYKAKTKAED